MKLAFYIGTSFDMEHYKLDIVGQMDRQHDIVLAKRFDADAVISNPKVKQIYIHADGAFRREISRKEIEEAEEWLGMPYFLMLKCWYNWDRKNENEKSLWKHYEAITRYVIYWRKFFAAHKPRAFITTIESTFPEIVSCCVAKKMGVEAIYLIGGRESNSFILYDVNILPIYWRKMDKKEAHQILLKLKEKFEAASGPQQASVAAEVAKYSDYSPSNVAYKLGRLWSYWRNYSSLLPVDKMRTLAPWGLVGKYITGEMRKHYAARLYRRLDYGKSRFILFTLNYMDEATLTYQEPFIDQIEIINSISKCLPVGCTLVVKPHPHWRCRDLEISKLREIARLRNVILCYPETSTYELIRKSLGVITVNSTSAYEALTFGKPVITLDHDCYYRHPATRNMQDLNELPQAVMEMASGKMAARQEDAEDLVGRYHKHLMFIEGTVGRFYRFGEKDGKLLADTIIEYLESDEAKKRKGGKNE